MKHSRKRIISLLSGTAVVATGVLVAQPAMAEPDIEGVQAKVDRLYREAEQASERYNALQVELEGMQKDLTSLRADQRRQTTRLRTSQEQVEDSIIAQFRGDNVATMGEVVVADDPSQFLNDLTALSSVTDIQTEQFDDFATERKALTLRTRATDRHVAEVAEAEAEAEAEKQEVSARLAEAKDVLADLKAEERARLEAAQEAARERAATQTVSRSETDEPEAEPETEPEAEPEAEPETEPETEAPAAPPASGGAGAAVQYALAQVGGSYVYGAAGPSAFDCSGLTMKAWAQGGVGLPHSSTAQMSSGTRVSSNALKPGDLVFYYSPVSHVGIYIGNGQIVHAANPSTGVSTTGVFSMPFSGAVRPG